MNTKTTTGHLLALFTMIVWGATFISTKILQNDFKPIEVLFIRFVIGVICLFIACPHILKWLGWKLELRLAAAGLCGVSIYYLLENIGLTYTYASNVGIILCTAPFFTGLLAHFFSGKQEKLSLNFLIGFFVAIIGIILISLNGASLQLNPKGDLMALAAAFTWACYCIITRNTGEYGLNTIQVTRRIFIYGLIFLIPALFIFDFNPDINLLLKPVNIFNMCFLGVFASAVCFVTWNTAVNLIGAIKTSIYIYVSPIVTVLLSALVLHEEITIMSATGSILTLIGMFISEGYNNKKNMLKDQTNQKL